MLVGLLNQRTFSGSDRPVGGLRRTHEMPGRAVRVAPGDSLWSLAARRLGPGASDQEISAYSRRLYARNAARLGPDPDLILPGQVLHLPLRRIQKS